MENSELKPEKPLSELPIEELESLTYVRSVEFDISNEDYDDMIKMLEPLKEQLPDTYAHSLRVSLLSGDISRAIPDLDPKPLFISGMAHDIGKLAIESEIVNKTEGFNAEDYEVMKQHCQKGFEMVRDRFPFSAEILLRHHTHAERPYPKVDRSQNGFSDETWARVEKYSKIIALADYYDAITTRHNDKYGEKPLTPDKIKELVMTYEPELTDIVKKLYLEGIFI